MQAARLVQPRPNRKQFENLAHAAAQANGLRHRQVAVAQFETRLHRLGRGSASELFFEALQQAVVDAHHG